MAFFCETLRLSPNVHRIYLAARLSRNVFQTFYVYNNQDLLSRSFMIPMSPAILCIVVSRNDAIRVLLYPYRRCLPYCNRMS